MNTINNYNKILYCKRKYYAVYIPDHHRASSDGYVYEHIIIAEQIIGRDLLDAEVVHHEDENGLNNSLANLIVFATSADHTTYHMCKRHNLKFNLSCKNNIYSVNAIPNRFCNMCGESISFGAKLCYACNHLSKKPSKEILKKYLSDSSYSHVARIYDVSPNAVKKWAKSYNLYECCFHKLPKEIEFVNFIMVHTVESASKKYDVPRTTINVWIKHFDVEIEPEQIKCVETNECFSSGRDVVTKLLPYANAKSKAEDLRKAISTGDTFCDYHWIVINKKLND